MKKRVLAVLLATTMLGSMMTACGGTEGTSETGAAESSAAGESAEGEVEVQDIALKVWTPSNQQDNGTIQSMAESFEELHPEYNIEWTFEVVGEDVARDEVLKDVENAADVFFYANDQVLELVAAGALAKLGGSTLDMINETMDPTVVATVTDPMDGSVYGIPFTHNTYFMYYDKTLMTEEDVKTVEGIVGKETADNVVNFYLESAGGWKLGAWYYGAGNTIFGESSVDFAAGCDWNNETGVAVTNYLLDLRDNTKVAFDNGISVSEKITNNELGVWFDGAWNYNTYYEILGEDLGLGILPTYELNGEATQLLGFYGSKAIGVNSNSDNLAAAVQFAAYLGSEEMQTQRFVETAQIPTNKAAAAMEEVLADPIAAVTVAEVANASVAQPFTTEFASTYWANVGGLTAEMKSGEINKDNVQEKLDAYVANFVIQ